MLWQVYAGAERFLSHPIATKTFTEDIIAPHITVCHDFPQFGYSLDQFGIGLADYEHEGQFSTQQDSAEDVFRSSTEQFYFVLDGSGEISYLGPGPGPSQIAPRPVTGFRNNISSLKFTW